MNEFKFDLSAALAAVNAPAGSVWRSIEEQLRRVTTEIEQMKPAEIAPLLGMKATAVAQLSFRAREGLREAWIQAHLQSVEDGSEHQWTIERLGAGVL